MLLYIPGAFHLHPNSLLEWPTSSVRSGCSQPRERRDVCPPDHPGTYSAPLFYIRMCIMARRTLSRLALREPHAEAEADDQEQDEETTNADDGEEKPVKKP